MPPQIVCGLNVSTSVFFGVNRFLDISYGLLIRYCMVLQKTGQGCQCQLWIQVLLFFFLLLLFASQALEILCRPRTASSSNGLYQSLTGRCKNFFFTSVHIFLGSNYIWYICKLSWPCFLTITSVQPMDFDIIETKSQSQSDKRATNRDPAQGTQEYPKLPGV